MRLPFDITDPRLAAAAWSRLLEPGDTAGGQVLASLGAAGGLDWLCHVAESPASLAKGVRQHVERWAPRLADLDIRRELDVLHRLGGTLLIAGEAGWPAALADLGHAAPPALWVRFGRARSIDFPPGGAVAVVGSRASTRYGEVTAAEFALALAEGGITVVSGGAYGIDAAAHRGALAATVADHPPTVAILAGGVDRLYPAGNEELLRRVLGAGALVAESPPGTAPGRHRFLSRNRLIAALTSATVVVEAAARSGAFSTANHATELLRPVGAVPGPITSQSSSGCHRMIREGQAVLITAAADIRELVAPMGEHLPPAPDVPAGLLDGLGAEQARVLDSLPARAGAEVASLVKVSGLAPGEVRSALGLLELAGRVRRVGTRWARA